MQDIRKQHPVALCILAAIIALNLFLAVNIVTGGTMLTSLLSGVAVFLFASVELVAVLVTYVVCKYGSLSPAS